MNNLASTFDRAILLPLSAHFVAQNVYRVWKWNEKKKKIMQIENQ